jgi:hypothetical protein
LLLLLLFFCVYFSLQKRKQQQQQQAFVCFIALNYASIYKNKIYYFLLFTATSSRDDLHRRIGGRCSSHNMKVVFKVCCKADEMDKGMQTIPSSDFEGLCVL